MLLPVGGRNFAVDIAGEGEPIVFIHGFPADRRMWREQVRKFSQNHNVITLDLPGFGESGPSPETMTMKDYAADIAAVLDELEIAEPVTLCGLSMGGYIAFAFHAAYRERMGHLILCDTKAAADTAEKRQGRHEMAQRALAEGTDFFVDEMLPNLLANGVDSTVFPEMKSMARNVTPEAVSAAMHGMAARPDVTERLSKIDVPTLVICGEDDAISPPDEMRGIAEAIPNARFEVIPGAGHFSPLENAAAVNRAIGEFLGE